MNFFNKIVSSSRKNILKKSTTWMSRKKLKQNEISTDHRHVETFVNLTTKECFRLIGFCRFDFNFSECLRSFSMVTKSFKFSNKIYSRTSAIRNWSAPMNDFIFWYPLNCQTSYYEIKRIFNIKILGWCFRLSILSIYWYCNRKLNFAESINRGRI